MHHRDDIDSRILTGAILREIRQADDFDPVSLIFDKGRLRIDNPFRLRCDFGETVTPLSLIGCCITAAYRTDSDFVLVFDGRISVSISLREEDFSGPAAAVFIPAKGDVVTFR